MCVCVCVCVMCVCVMCVCVCVCVCDVCVVGDEGCCLLCDERCDLVFLPCGHITMCHSCGKTARKCSQCRVSESTVPFCSVLFCPSVS